MQRMKNWKTIVPKVHTDSSYRNNIMDPGADEVK